MDGRARLKRERQLAAQKAQAARVEALIDTYLATPGYIHGLAGFPAADDILAASPVDIPEIVIAIARRRSRRRLKPRTSLQREHRGKLKWNPSLIDTLRQIQSRLLGRSVEWDEYQLVRLLRTASVFRFRKGAFPVKPTLGLLERHQEKIPLSPEIVSAIHFASWERLDHDCSDDEVSERINSLTNGKRTVQTPKNSGRKRPPKTLAVPQEVEDLLQQISPFEAAYWRRLFESFLKKPSNLPTQKWLRATTETMAPIEDTLFRRRMETWLWQEEPNHKLPFYVFLQAHEHFDRQLIWACAIDRTPEMSELLGRLAVYLKDKGWTNLYAHAAKTLGQQATFEAVRQLQWLSKKYPKPSARGPCERAIDFAARKLKLSRADVEELSVNDFGLGQNGRIDKEFGGYSGSIILEEATRVVVLWTNADGKSLKSTPKPVSRSHSEELSAFRKEVTSIRQQVSLQKLRLEKLFKIDPRWINGDWQERYMQHGLLRHFAERLIWVFEIAEDQPLEGIPSGDTLLLSDGSTVPLPSTGHVRLWHPIIANAAQVRRWRNFMLTNELKQPIRQAFRELYVLTDAERETGTYSNRFSGHVLQQKPFQGMMRTRGWRSPMYGSFDPGGEPTLKLSDDKSEVIFRVLNESDESYATFVTTEEIFFVGEEGKGQALESIQPRVFSEVMRDIDLFVSVASVGADPEWIFSLTEGQHRDYAERWSRASLTPAAETRREMLAGILPGLPFSETMKLEARNLKVDGALTTYRIHLGSGAIKMAPDDQYLCIVTSKKSSKTNHFTRWLLEDDPILSAIVSKAILLANDTAIRDQSILSQIKARSR